MDVNSYAVNGAVYDEMMAYLRWRDERLDKPMFDAVRKAGCMLVKEYFETGDVKVNFAVGVIANKECVCPEELNRFVVSFLPGLLLEVEARREELTI